MGFLQKLFSKKEEGKCFRNSQELTIPDRCLEEHLIKLDLQAFPLIEEFTIEVKDTGKYFGCQLDFQSSNYGHLASFAWWDFVDRDLARYTFKDIPVGGIQSDPYFDLDQGWNIIIFEDATFVYVMEGADERTTFHAWFRVPRQHYYSEWLKTINHYNPHWSEDQPTILASVNEEGQVQISSNLNPADYVALNANSWQEEPTLAHGRWVVLWLLEGSIPSYMAPAIAIETVRKFQGQIQLGIHHSDGTLPLPSWCPLAQAEWYDPTWLFFEEGQLVGHEVGYISGEWLKQRIKAIFATNC